MKKSGIVGMCLIALVVGVAAKQTPSMAQQAPAAPQNLVAEVLAQFTSVSTNAIKSADKFPEDKYKWQPTPDVRTWAQMIAHMTDDANGQCFAIAGLAARPASIERAAQGAPAGAAAPVDSMTKAQLVAALTAAYGVCNTAFTKVTADNMLQMVGGRGNVSNIGRLVTITAHANEHYGNLVTYMRLQGVVPPSTADRGRGRGGV